MERRRRIRTPLVVQAADISRVMVDVSELVQKTDCNMAASEILIRDRGISVRAMSDVEADNIEQCDSG